MTTHEAALLALDAALRDAVEAGQPIPCRTIDGPSPWISDRHEDRHEAEEGCTARCLSHALRHHKDADRGAAVALAVDLAWIDERAGRYFPGAAQPTEAGGAA